MQALNCLALVCATFEQARANLEVGNPEGDLLHADVRAAMEDFDEAKQNQERMRGELKDFLESLDSAFAEFNEANRNLDDPGKGITETRKADDAHEQMRTHRDRCRRATKEFETAEDDFNECLGSMEQLTQDTAEATHALSCGVPDRDSNEVRCLQEVLDMIEDFQRRVLARTWQKSSWWSPTSGG